MSVNEKMTAIADGIRSKTGQVEKLTLDAMATAVEQVYEAGSQACRDDFWDAYQQTGNRLDYAGAFGGHGWVNQLFRPKYDMRPTNAMYMFRTTRISGDLPALLQELGITLDFSECTNAVEAFSNAPDITRVGVVDLRKAPLTGNAFAFCGVKTIDKVIVSANTGMNSFPGAAMKLVNLTVEGVIGQTGFDASYCTKLNRVSIESIINALSTTTRGLSITLSQTAVTNAFGSTTATEWTTLVGTRSNWTISLV